MLEKLSDPGKVKLWAGSVPVRHRYTPGIAGEAFFRALKEDGRLLASRCESCGITYCPARLFCERCFAELEPGVTVGPQGVLESFTVGYQGPDGERLNEPAMVGLVRLDGADTVFVHFLVEVEEGALEIGRRVEAVFLPKQERTGSILDLQGFRLLEP
ncbi:MAG: Zn-ribbon domain-containing OB-fold protein [Actinomycetota bacterium]